MSETSLEDVVERLAALEAAVKELTAAVTSRGVSSTASASVSAAAAAPKPAPAAPSAPTAPSQAAEALSEVDDDTPQVVRELPPGMALPSATDGPDIAIIRMFQYALVEPRADSDELLATLTHPMQMRGPRSLDHLRAFNWTKLRRSADRYLNDRNPTTFHIVRTDPVDAAEADFVKVYLEQISGMPAPVHLRRDEASGGAWRVDQISL